MLAQNSAFISTSSVAPDNSFNLSLQVSVGHEQSVRLWHLSIIRQDKIMKRFHSATTFLLDGLLGVIVVTLSVLCAPLFADTLELIDGEILEGDFVGSSNNIIMFDTGGGIQAFPETEVVGIYLSSGVDIRASQPQQSTVVVPAGTRLVIRMTDAIDSRQHKAGHRFRGQLEAALVVEGVTAAPRGAFVYGQIIESKKSGRLAGSATLAITFTDIMLDDQFYPIVVTGLQAQGSNEAGKTVGRTARAAVIGGLIGGSSGAKTGAKVGVGASILTSGSSLSVPAGTLLETKLAEALELTISQ